MAAQEEKHIGHCPSFFPPIVTKYLTKETLAGVGFHQLTEVAVSHFRKSWLQGLEETRPQSRDE